MYTFVQSIYYASMSSTQASNKPERTQPPAAVSTLPVVPSTSAITTDCQVIGVVQQPPPTSVVTSVQMMPPPVSLPVGAGHVQGMELGTQVPPNYLKSGKIISTLEFGKKM